MSIQLPISLLSATAAAQPTQSVKYWGATGDGVTDDTLAVQRAIDSNKGGAVYFPPGTYLVAGLTLNSSAYNDTQLIGLGGELKFKADGGNSTYGGAWICVLVQNASRVTIQGLHFNCNRSAMTATREQIFAVASWPATDLVVADCRFREIQGDGLYVSNVTTTNSKNLQVTNCTFVNAADNGRNAISIISCDGFNIQGVTSYQVGGTINGFLEPGGIDIEPDSGTNERVRHGTITNVVITSAGTGGLNILGKAITNDATRDWNVSDIAVSNLVVNRTGTSGSGLSASNISRCKDVSFKNCRVSYTAGTYGKGWYPDWSDRLDLDLSAVTCTVGVGVGVVDSVRDSTIRVNVQDYSSAGLLTTETRRVTFTGKIANSTVVGSTPFAIQANNSGRTVTQVKTIYSVDCPYDGVQTKGFRNEQASSVTFDADCRIQNCDFSGYSTPAIAIDVNAAPPFKSNVSGVTFAASIPTVGYWLQGEFVENTVPAAGETALLGWTRLTTGTGAVSGTDWQPSYILKQSTIVTAAIAANAVTNAKAAQMATKTIKGNVTGGTADPVDLVGYQARQIVETLSEVAVSDAGSVTPDLNTANTYRITFNAALTTMTMNAPLVAGGAVGAPQDGAKLRVSFVNGSGNPTPTITWNSGTGGYSFINTATFTVPVANKTRYIEFSYSSAAGKWIETFRSISKQDPVDSVGAVGAVPNANGLTLGTDGSLILQPADGTNPGALTATLQTIGGNKTFTGQVKPQALLLPTNNPTYGTTVTPDFSQGNIFVIIANNGTAFTVAAPTNMTNQQLVFITVRNTSGGALGAISWNAAYHFAGGAAPAAPATGTEITIMFRTSATVCWEYSRTSGNVTT